MSAPQPRSASRFPRAVFPNHQADHQRESTAAPGRDTGRVIRDDDAPAWPRRQAVGHLDEYGRIPCDQAVHVHRKQLADACRSQHVLAVAA